MTRRPSRVLAAAGAAALSLLLAACETPKTLYHWGTFPRQQYIALKHEGVSPDEQIRQLEAQAEKARGAAAALPPGFRAHLGMLHLGAGNPGRARELWQAEKEAFPESAVYMDSLLKRLDGGGAPASSPVPPAAPASGPATTATTPARPA